MIYLILAATLNLILCMYLGVYSVVHNRIYLAALNFGIAGLNLGLLSIFLLSW